MPEKGRARALRLGQRGAGGGEDPGNMSRHPKVCLPRARGARCKRKKPHQGLLLKKKRPNAGGRSGQAQAAGEGSLQLPSWGARGEEEADGGAAAR